MALRPDKPEGLGRRRRTGHDVGVPSHLAPERLPWVIVGCGYTGEHLAARLVALGVRIVVTRRAADDASALAERLGDGARARAADLLDPGTLEGLIPPGAVVVDSAPPSGDLAAERNLAAACAAAGARRLVYISSTGVYPRMEPGTWIDEDTDTDPFGDRGASRLEAESALLTAAAARDLEAVALRAPGIYGPDRGVAARLQQGRYRVIGAGDSYVSRIHVHDLGSAILAAGTVDPLPRSIYVVGDDEPTTSRAHADGAAARLGLPPPPSVPMSEVSADLRAMMGANRRVDNTRMKQELGVELRYPTWRDALE